MLKVNFDTQASVYISLCSHMNFATSHICEAFIIFCHYFKAIIVMFNQSEYIVNEDAGSAQPVLVISSPLSTDITIHVTSTDALGIGEH